MQKSSFGGGYGLNRNVGGASAHGVAKPPMRNVSVHPGLGKQLPGCTKMGGKHFQGAKVISGKK
jgi:hypothetical protein